MFVLTLAAQTAGLATKANTGDVYTKLLTHNKEETCSQTQVNEMFTQTLLLIAAKANTNDVYTKLLTYSKEQTFRQTQINEMFTQALALTTGKANTVDVYTKNTQMIY